MKFLLLLATILISEISSLPSSKDIHVQWNNFLERHQKIYDASESARRMQIFQSNLEKIEEHNKLYEKNEVSYKMAVNKFADLTENEFLQYATGFNANIQNGTTFKRPTGVEIPDATDWRDKGAVTEVKDQHVDICGACWAFSVTGALEGQNFLKYGELISLSEQELVDCIIARLRGCNGGFADQAYRYVIDHGLATEAEYPYEAEDNLCRRGSLESAVTEIGYVIIFGNEEVLKEAVATVGPIAVGVNTPNWQFYSGGIFYDSECVSDVNSLNHAVLVVGYGTDDEGTDYWLVKNQYGTEWGEDGYIRIKRNADNHCGLATSPTYPVV